MNGRIVLLILISTFLLLALVVAASASTRTVGVNVGNTFRYSARSGWTSTDPNAVPPSSLLDVNDSQWVEFTVTAISGTRITGQGTTLYKNGTEITQGAWIDVRTGDGANLTEFVVSANLTPGDSIYNSADYTDWIINETVSRTYPTGARDTNHLNSTLSSGTDVYLTSWYWDRSTGVAVEALVGTISQNGPYVTTQLIVFEIISSDLWIVPEFPTWTSTLLMFIALTSATIVVAGTKKPKDPSTKLSFFS
jgi:hypothetical protein